MDLTRSQKRELMWLASVAKDGGAIDDKDLNERKQNLGNATLDDFKYRYDALKEARLVDSLVHAWGEPVIMVRLTEEGRERADEYLEEEMSSPLVTDETKRTVKDTLVSEGIGAAFKVLLAGVGFII